MTEISRSTTQEEMPRYILTYFNTRGRAEPIRLILAQAGVDYEDKRITREQWAQLKPQTPFGHIPILEVDGKVLSGSLPVTRFLAERHGLAGSNDVENAEIAGIVDCITDLIAQMIKWMSEKDETCKAELKKEMDKVHTPKHLSNLEKHITAEGWLYGSKVTYADLIFFNFSHHLSDEVLAKYPGLKGLREKVEALPNIAKWLKEHPVTKS